MKMKVVYIQMILFFICFILAGCGETVRGMGKDAHRIGKGTKTIFVADE